MNFNRHNIPAKLRTLYLFREDRGGSGPDSQSQSAPEETTKDEEEKLYCTRCATWITSGPWRISVQDGHEHTFFNPAGVIFQVGCFKEAPGARAIGIPSDEFTWFKGHHWQAGLCSGCKEHLGWLFTGDSAFYCLILKKLTSHP